MNSTRYLTLCYCNEFFPSKITNKTRDPCIKIVNSRPDIVNMKVAFIICVGPELVTLLLKNTCRVTVFCFRKRKEIMEMLSHLAFSLK